MYQTPEIFELGRAEKLTFGLCDWIYLDRDLNGYLVCAP